MEKAVESLYAPDILRQAAMQWGVTPEQCLLIGDVENYVYACDNGEDTFILRLTHSSHRDAAMIQGELEWMAYLAQQDVPVVAPRLSINNLLVETFPAQDTFFHAVAFEKAPGQLADRTNPDIWNTKLFRTWGKSIGKLHRATVDYQVSSPAATRKQWDEDFIMVRAEQLIGHDPDALEEFHQLLAFFTVLPKTESNYGLIHSDVHNRNFFVDGDRITIFDFDDASYHWFLFDIAVVLYHFVIGLPAEKRQQAADEFLPSFLEGYTEEYPLEDNWKEQAQQLIRFREVFMYIWLHNKWDITTLKERQSWFFRITFERMKSREPLIRLVS